MRKIEKAMSLFLSITLIFMLSTNVVCMNTIIASAYDKLYYGIDVSKYQGNINWQSVASANIDFAIVRCGTTNFNQETMLNDQYFGQNYSGAISNGIPVGAYYFTSAYTLEGMRQNAYDCLSILDGRHLDLPVFIDVENESRSTYQVGLGKETLTEYLLEALNILHNAGYKAGVYSAKSFLSSYVDTNLIKANGYYIWIAQYPSGSYAVDPTGYDKSDLCSIWQYSDKGVVSGVSGSCDVNVSYTDFSIPPDDVVYYPKCSSEITSLIKGLDSIGVDSSKEFRTRIAEANGIVNYSFTAEQNIYMLELLKAGRLIDPDGVKVTCICSDISMAGTYIINDSDGSTNIRAAENSSSAVIATIPNGTKVTVTKGTGNWYYVEEYGGHCYASNLQKVNESIIIPTITLNKSEYLIGETVHITWAASSESSNISHYWINLIAPDGTWIDEGGQGLRTTYSFTPFQQGEYKLVVYATPKGSVSGEGSLQDEAIIAVSSLKGDVNTDGKFNITDVVMLQKWILAVKNTELTDWQAADLCEDGVINTFDLVMMKRMLINK